MTDWPKEGFLTRGSAGRRLAWRRSAPPQADKPSLLWLGGFASDMQGTKASHLAQWAEQTGQSLIRFDYGSHGESPGDFASATLGDWRDDMMAVLDKLASGPQILIGSSMGAWLALLAARAKPDKVKALLLIAPAPDFTERLILPSLSESQKIALQRKGAIHLPDAPEPLSWRFVQEARAHCLLDQTIPLSCPVHILHGAKDQTVPLSHLLLLLSRLDAPDILCRILREGDHRLSSPEALKILRETASALSDSLSSASARKPSR